MLCIVAVFPSCSNITKNIDFLRTNGVTEIESVPTSFESGKGWKELAGDYVYFLNLYNLSSDPQMIYLVANKRTEEIIGAYNINAQIMPASVAKGVDPATIVTNYTEISPKDLEAADDMNAFNMLLKKIPEMKDFSWKNDLQNRIASGILMKTHFIFASGTSFDGGLYNGDPTMPQTALLKRILKEPHNIYTRPVQRLNENVDMNQFIQKMEFQFQSTDGTATLHPEYKEKRYVNDIFKDDPIEFKGAGKMFFFYPFKSYVRAKEKEGMPGYSPAIHTVEYTYETDAEGFPVFKRKSRFASLLNQEHVEK